MPHQLRKKLLRIDIASAYVRHMTAAAAEDMYAQVDAALDDLFSNCDKCDVDGMLTACDAGFPAIAGCEMFIGDGYSGDGKSFHCDVEGIDAERFGMIICDLYAAAV